MGSFVDKGSGSGIFPDPGDQKRPDPTGSGSGSGSATLVYLLPGPIVIPMVEKSQGQSVYS